MEEKEEDFRLSFQPELISEDDLRRILRPRCFHLDLSKSNKEKLVELFYRIGLPLPQRIYKDTYRGKLLNSRIKAALSNSSSSRKSNGINALYSPLLKRSHDGSPKSSKPTIPLPDQINYTRKTIKLSTKSSSDSKLAERSIKFSTDKSSRTIQYKSVKDHSNDSSSSSSEKRKRPLITGPESSKYHKRRS